MENDLTKLLSILPEVLRPQVQYYWDEFVVAATPEQCELCDEVATTLPRVWAGSEFVARNCIRYPDLLKKLQQSGDLSRSYETEEYRTRLETLVKGVGSEAGLATILRQFRRYEMLRIVWRDIAGWADLQETTADLSALAEACIDVALWQLYQWQCKKLGTPYSDEGKAQHLVVLGMGKLGAWELNVSSDIDLIFTYPQDGQTRGGAKEISNAEFFIALGQLLINALNRATADGFVFRVDMRLRPFGDSGALAVSFGALENYYVIHGREWERYAMIKARVVAGDREAGEALMNLLRPFVYRRYLDFGAYEAMREMKELIVHEVKRKGLEHNIKLGAGGIREVEFIGQVFQLIRGGREPALQERRLLPVLEQLSSMDILPAYVVAELKAAYVFLRTTEHRLQEFADQQTHLLPEDDLGQARLAYAMGFPTWTEFAQVMQQHRDQVQSHFEQVFSAPQTRHAESDPLDLQGVWLARLEDGSACEALAKAGFEQTKDLLRHLQALHRGSSYQTLSARGRERMDRLMPLLLGAAGQAENTDVVGARLLDLIECIARRTVYLALLVENPMALSQLVKLCAASPWIAQYLTQHPLLLDDLLDPRSLYAPPDRGALEKELITRLAQVPMDDMERVMDELQHFKHTNVLRVAAADVSNGLPLMQVSSHLSWIAEVVLGAALEQAWEHLVTRHGRPACQMDGQPCDKGFAMVAYGKLGGLELGYGSDLDLVFLHAGENQDQLTDGAHPIPLPVFFARLGQRLIHILTVHTPAGILYEVDVRLRPNGASGMLVSSLDAFSAYQQDKAWVWEHQALVRARVVVGDPLIARQFDAIRRAVLGQPRARDTLRQEVRDMRLRMFKAHSHAPEGYFDLKQGAGGIVDIEFMVQYLVLAWACEYPILLDHTDNIRFLAGLRESGVMPANEVALLGEAYRTYRDRLHRMTLQAQITTLPDSEYADLRAGVRRVWQTLLEDE